MAKARKIRIILGNEVTKRTRDILSEAASYLRGLNTSIDDEHVKNTDNGNCATDEGYRRKCA